MIIDSHAHIVLPSESLKYMTELVGGRGNPAQKKKVSIESIRACGQQVIDIMDKVGTNMQFISPRPYLSMHSVRPSTVTELWTAHCNDLIHETVKLFPDRFRAVAGLPQYRDESPENCLKELEFRVKEQGFIGCLLNPDPTEGDGPPPPGLGHPFWYPLYEKMCELDVPALIHSASSCQPRESYTLKFINEESIGIISLVESDIFKKFPKLKIIAPHGGGAIPYQMGRFRSWAARRNKGSFDDEVKKIYFDTTNYDPLALELMIRVVGADRVLFGTEKPGTGSAYDNVNQRDFDDLKPVIESMQILTDTDKKAIFSMNARRLFTRFVQ
jgi:4-oxalmesaconate hydratase